LLVASPTVTHRVSGLLGEYASLPHLPTPAVSVLFQGTSEMLGRAVPRPGLAGGQRKREVRGGWAPGSGGVEVSKK